VLDLRALSSIGIERKTEATLAEEDFEVCRRSGQLMVGAETAPVDSNVLLSIKKYNDMM
jgi:hypothetical protein